MCSPCITNSKTFSFVSYFRIMNSAKFRISKMRISKNSIRTNNSFSIYKIFYIFFVTISFALVNNFNFTPTSNSPSSIYTFVVMSPSFRLRASFSVFIYFCKILFTTGFYLGSICGYKCC